MTKIDSHVDALAKRDLHPALAFGARKHIQRLKSELGASENLLQMSWTTSPNFAAGLLALTTERLIYIRKAFLLPLFRIRTIPLKDVTAITERKGAVGVLTCRVSLPDDRHVDFRFTPDATNREAIIDLLRVLSDQYRAKLGAKVEDAN